MMTEHSFLDKLFLSPCSSLACDISSFYLANRRVIISHCPLRALASAVNTHALLQTLRRVTNTPITAPHITRHILDVTRINICLCYVLIMASQCTALNCFIYHCIRSSAALVFIACKHFKQMLCSCMQVQELLFSGRKSERYVGNVYTSEIECRLIFKCGGDGVILVSVRYCYSFSNILNEFLLFYLLFNFR